MQHSRKEELRQKQFSGIWGNELKLVFHDVADEYDKANAFISFGLWRLMRYRFINRISLFDDAKVLDVCAGTNAVGIDLLRRNPNLTITAVDRSREMQQIGQTKAFESGLAINSVISDVHKLPFPDNSFDIITLEAATRHLEVEKAFTEIFRVLKPGGSFYHCDLYKPKNRAIAFLYFNYLRTMLPVTSFVFFRTKDFLGTRNKVFQLRDYFIEAINMFYTSHELSSILDDVGFLDIDVDYLFGGIVAVHKASKQTSDPS